MEINFHLLLQRDSLPTTGQPYGAPEPGGACKQQKLFFFFFDGSLHLEPLHQPCFVLGIFKIGSLELFAWAGFESESS
jgi:hypothetical protein